MSDARRPFVSVVFPAFNAGPFVLATIEALLNQAYPSDRLEVIVVDNGSTDGSMELVRRRFGEAVAQRRLKLVALGENRGCPAGYNAGMAQMVREAAYLLRVDDDLVLEPDCVRELVACAEAEPTIGVVGGKVKYFLDRGRLHLVGSRISPWFGACLGIGKHALDRGQFDTPRDVQAVNGCLMLVRRGVLERIGGIEEAYFLYFEDIDWALRATRAGFRHRYAPRAVAYHDTATPTERYRSTRWAYFNLHNTCFLAKRNFSRTGQLICWGVLSLKALAYVPLVLAHARGRSPAVLRAMWEGYWRGSRLLLSLNGLVVRHGNLQAILGG